jgi:hypothetical protein
MFYLRGARESVSERAERGAGAQEDAVARHEVCVASHLGRGVELRDHGLEEGVLGCGVALALELGDPKRSVAARCVGSIDVGHEGIGVTTVVPVDADEIDLAVGACTEEVLEPGQAHGATAVGNGWGSELGLSGEGGVHVGLVCGGCCFRGEVGLSVEIGLVEGHEMGGARGERLGSCRDPVVCEAGTCSPEERNIFECGGDGCG